MHKSFERLAVEQAINQLFSKKHFNVCLLREIGKMIGTNPEQSPIFPYLQSLHCVDYADMQPALREQLQAKVVECLRPTFNTNALIHALTAEGHDFTPTEDRYLDGPPHGSAH